MKIEIDDGIMVGVLLIVSAVVLILSSLLYHFAKAALV